MLPKKTNGVIVVTGAFGFIGSTLVAMLNQKGFTNLILVDDFSKNYKEHNLSQAQYVAKIERDNFFHYLTSEQLYINCIYHLGARTDTTEQDKSIFDTLNLDFSKNIWHLATQNNIPLVYASSAATYGNGEWGYKDTHDIVTKLVPLNPYAVSKNEFDIWALQQSKTPPFWAGLKFFNVFGPNEYHKNRMASVVFHAYNQIKEKGTISLFRSHKPEYADGEQKRDFIYVKDIVNICLWMAEHQPQSGLYNAGTGTARSFNDLANAVFTALDIPAHIQYIDTPIDIRESYQYFTQADTDKLLQAGYNTGFTTLEDAVKDYVQHYLKGR